MTIYKLQATSEERYITINALSDAGKKLIDKEKSTGSLTREEQKTLNSIENLIKQLAFQ